MIRGGLRAGADDSAEATPFYWCRIVFVGASGSAPADAARAARRLAASGVPATSEAPGSVGAGGWFQLSSHDRRRVDSPSEGWTSRPDAAAYIVLRRAERGFEPRRVDESLDLDMRIPSLVSVGPFGAPITSRARVDSLRG